MATNPTVVIWTDRAHLIKTDFFNSLAPFPNGGPGPRHHDRWNENYLQEVFSKNGYEIAHIHPAMFRDNGVWTVREIAGGKCYMRTDTKALWWKTPPKESYVFPELTEEEWKTSIEGKWVGGTIPEAYQKEDKSFNCWGAVLPPDFS